MVFIVFINSKAFSKSIYDRIGWKEDYCFKFRGITRVRGNAKLMIFYLDEPQIIPSKKSIKELINEAKEENDDEDDDWQQNPGGTRSGSCRFGYST